jgi:hypothetical protein
LGRGQQRRGRVGVLAGRALDPQDHGAQPVGLLLEGLDRQVAALAGGGEHGADQRLEARGGEVRVDLAQPERPPLRLVERLPALPAAHRVEQVVPAERVPRPAERLGHRLGHGHDHRGGGHLGVLEGDQHRLPGGLLAERDLERPGR